VETQKELRAKILTILDFGRNSDMEQLQYIIEDKTIAYLLGVNNFTSDNSAILEIVKNAYDANALTMSLVFSGDTLTITDDGIGMNEDDIRTHWMHVGQSDKEYYTQDKYSQKRVLAGSKGVGRFALARLGENVELLSKKEKCSTILWKTDWNYSALAESQDMIESGTKIIISKLRSKWSKSKVLALVDFLSKTYNDNLMNISITYQDKTYHVYDYFSSPIIGKNCLSIIDLSYDSKKKELCTSVKSDEFLDTAEVYCKNLSLKGTYNQKSMVEELNSFDFDLDNDALSDCLGELGDFSAQFYFYIKPTRKDIEKFMYKHAGLTDSFSSGVILYRNAFSISAYEGDKDWLELGKRSRQSPAAASHPTGAWRVRDNQIAGKVEIDKRENMYLIDLSNRQGLEENVYFKLFIAIIHSGISEFERYRQDIVRAINAKNLVEDKEVMMPVSEMMIKNYKIALNMSEQQAKQLSDEIKIMRKENQEVIAEKNDTEERYKYDVRILNTLATVGLKASSIAHEMENDRNSISENTEYIIKALKKYGFWEELTSPEKSKHSYDNVKYLLESNDEKCKKIVSFMNVMLSQIEKNQFEPAVQSTVDILKRIKDEWEADYATVQINIHNDKDIIFHISEDVLKVIFDNLILNSIQQNEKKGDLNIDINVVLVDGKLSFVYSDNGRGLDKKYIKHPRKILEVHETNRKKGHGLGMWIVNNTVIMTGGSIEEINGNNGFSISFTVGGIL